MGGAGDAGSHGIANAIDEGATLAGQFHGCQRVGRLATLRDGDDHVAWSYHGVAVAKLRGVLHIDGHTTERLDELLADETGVPARTTGHDDDALGREQLLAVVDDGREGHVVVVHVDAPAHAVL